MDASANTLPFFSQFDEKTLDTAATLRVTGHGKKWPTGGTPGGQSVAVARDVRKLVVCFEMISSQLVVCNLKVPVQFGPPRSRPNRVPLWAEPIDKDALQKKRA